jgi:hypothetical protein
VHAPISSNISAIQDRRMALPSLKGAQTRSCSVSVLMEETAEQVASMYSALLLLANDRQAAGLIWRLSH